jgi:hypothetical protein
MIRQGVGNTVDPYLRYGTAYLSGSVNNTSLTLMSLNEVPLVPGTVPMLGTYGTGIEISDRHLLSCFNPFLRKRKARGGKGRRDREPFTPEDQQQQLPLPPPKERTPPTAAGKDDNKEVAATEDAAPPEVVYVAAPLPKVRFTKYSAKISQKSVRKTSVADPDLGSGAFFTPGSGMGRKSASGSGIRDEQPRSYFQELRNHFFGLKYIKHLNSLMRIRDGDSSDPGSGIRDGKKSDPGSGINIPDPQRCEKLVQYWY